MLESRLGGKKPNNFLSQLSLVHYSSEGWTGYGSSPPIALFWPHSLEEKEYSPSKGQFHKNVGSSPLGLRAQICTDAEHIPSITEVLTLVISQFPSITLWSLCCFKHWEDLSAIMHYGLHWNSPVWFVTLHCGGSANTTQL